MSLDDSTHDLPAGQDPETAEDPFAVFRAWLGDAETSEPNDPNAMAIASVDGSGLPNVRMVLLKELDERGFVFYTNTQSVKGHELSAHPKAALCFHWKSLLRQVRVRGLVEPVSTAQADAYYASRARGSRIGAWASLQSRPLDSRKALEDAVAHYDAKFGDAVPRPAHWSGFRVCPLEIEFWRDRQYRLHDRIVFRRAGLDTGWERMRLYP